MKITQSFMKDFREYLEGGGCGILIRERWIKGRLIEDEPEEPGSKELGAYFEYIFSGAKPKNGKEPKPELLKSEAKNMSTEKPAVHQMLEPYRRAHMRAELLRLDFFALGFEIIGYGLKKTEGDSEGTIDLEVKCTRALKFKDVSLKKGEIIHLDLKFSGLISDTTPSWNVHGWKWSDVQKRYHGTQAKQYSHVGRDKAKKLRKFFFCVVSSVKDNADRRLFYVPITETMIQEHLEEGHQLRDRLLYLDKIAGLEARPALKKCDKCPLREECKQRQTYPHPEKIIL